MNAQEQWILKQLDHLFEESKDYKQKALIRATKKIIEEQETRKEQMQGELDGTLWSPGNWS